MPFVKAQNASLLETFQSQYDALRHSFLSVILFSLVASIKDAITFFSFARSSFIQELGGFPNRRSVIGNRVFRTPTCIPPWVKINHMMLVSGTKPASHPVFQRYIAVTPRLGSQDVNLRDFFHDLLEMLPKQLFTLIECYWFVKQMLNGVFVVLVSFFNVSCLFSV